MDEPQQRPYLAEWWPRVGATLLDGVLITVASLARAWSRRPALTSQRGDSGIDLRMNQTIKAQTPTITNM